MTDSQPSLGSATETLHLFVDEAGSPDLFDGKGRVLVGTEGCSRYFILGMLEVDDPLVVTRGLEALRKDLLADPYFRGVESFRPERAKTARMFHAKDDLPEVRFKVFDLLRGYGDRLRFRAVVCDKLVLVKEEQAKRQGLPKYRYNPDHLYDRLTHALLAKFSATADAYKLCVAKRGNRERNAALREALLKSEAEFTQRFGFSRGGPEAWETRITTPIDAVCLQAADYFLWVLQRFYEPRKSPDTGAEVHEDRFLTVLWPQFSQVYDLDFGEKRGTYFIRDKPLTVESRFPSEPRKKKKPQV